MNTRNNRFAKKKRNQRKCVCPEHDFADHLKHAKLIVSKWPLWKQQALGPL